MTPRSPSRVTPSRVPPFLAWSARPRGRCSSRSTRSCRCACRRTARLPRVSSRAPRQGWATTLRARSSSRSSSPAIQPASTTARNQIALSAVSAIATHLGSLRGRPQDARRPLQRRLAGGPTARAMHRCRESTRLRDWRTGRGWRSI
jgi:hypothetical protein